MKIMTTLILRRLVRGIAVVKRIVMVTRVQIVRYGVQDMRVKIVNIVYW
jgi:hypothetical protein